MLRRFNGSSDELRFADGSSNLLTNYTIAVFGRPQAAAEGTFISFWSAGVAELLSFGMNASKQPRLKVGVTVVSGAEIEVTPTTGQFGLWVVSKEGGEKKPRWHHFGQDTGVWKHADDGTAVGDPVTQVGGSIRSGFGTTMGFGKFDAVAMAVWTKKLSDAEIESLRTTLGSVIGWKALGPVGLWRYKQGVVTEEVPDDTGNGASQSARTGTTVLEEEPPFPYDPSVDLGMVV